MSDIKPAVGSSAAHGADAEAPAEIDVQEFSNLVGGMSRLLGGLGQVKPFSDGGLSLAEWVTLTALAQWHEGGNKDGAGKKAEAENQLAVGQNWIAHNLGVTGQRANQIITSLARGGYVTIEDSTRAKLPIDVRITAVGIEKMNAVNAELQPLLSRALAGTDGALGAASKRLRVVSRIVLADKPNMPGKRRKAGRAEASAKTA